MIRRTSEEELTQLFIEIFLDKTDKVTKVSNNSVMYGIAAGIGKVGAKAMKDIALTSSHIFPSTAYGTYLDEIAQDRGVASRFTAIGSSTYVRIFADPGTAYVAGFHQITGNHGLLFDIEEDVVIDTTGVAYVKVQSTEVGSQTNVSAGELNTMNPIPSGHINVVNEFGATGGRDSEDDDLFRRRIMEGSNILATGTLASLEQAFMKINPQILKLFHHGMSDGKIVLAVATVNGADLTQNELDALVDQGGEYFAITELGQFGQNVKNIIVRNIEYQPVDVSFRVLLNQDANVDIIRRTIQTRMARKLDLRTFDSSKDKFEWDDMLQIVKSTRGVSYVPDQYFVPNNDVAISINKLPRIRGFRMLDINGAVIANIENTISSVFYPNEADFSYQQTVLADV